MNKNSNLFVLIFLGIIWSTFALFTKVVAESLSPYFIAFSRLALGSSLLLAVCFFQQKKIFVVKNFRHYAIVGFFNSALPFTLFAFAAKALDAGVVSILDGTVPMFEVLISLLILRRHVDKNAIIGVFFGIVGTIFTSLGNDAKLAVSTDQLVLIIAILTATCSYAGASLYISAKCKKIEPISLATGSVLFAAMFLSPSLFFTSLSSIDAKTAYNLLGLGLLCTGFAYIFYFKLAAEESPRVAVSVVLLIPVFGTIFGATIFGEEVSIGKIIGCVTILISLKFILNLSRANFFKSKEAPLV